MQKQFAPGGVIERWVPICYGSHKWSSAAKNWATVQKELYGLFSGVTDCSSYLLGRSFVLATDHKNLVYLRSSKIPKLVRWHLALSEFQFTIVHIPGQDNVVADVLSRFFKIVIVEDREWDVEEFLESVHNSFVGHLGVSRLIKTLEAHDIEWPDMKKDISEFVKRCPICQKLKVQTVPKVITEGYTLHGSAPMEHVTVDSIGPFPEDEFGMKYVLHLMCAFSKFNILVATQTTDAMSYVHALVQWIGLFGVPSKVRTDGGSQFTANVCKELASFMGFEHIVIIPYHPQANGDNERWNGEVNQALRAIILDRRVTSTWSLVLPIVQRVLNASYSRGIGTYPARVIFGDNLPIAQPFLLRKEQEADFQPMHQYIQKLNDDIKMIVGILERKFKNDLSVRQKKLQLPEGKVVEFDVDEYVLITYPNKRPTKLSSMYRGPMKVMTKIRDDIFEVMDLVSQKVLTVHVDRLRKFNAGKMNEQELLKLASADVDEYIVKEILEHKYEGSKKKSNLWFLVSWEGYEPEYNSWEPYKNLKDVEALDTYSALHPELKLV
jgi:hypothetical protein